MKVRSVHDPFMDEITAAFYATAEEIRDQAKANAAGLASHNPKTGTHANNIKMWRRKRKDRPTATVGSRKTPYTGILERGGGPAAGWGARGPHVQRNRAPRPITSALPSFPARYEARLRAIGVGGGGITAAYMDHGPRERGEPIAMLVGR